MAQIQTQDFTSVKMQALAQSAKLKHTILTPEHLLLGIMLVPECDAGVFLRKKGLSVGKLRTGVINRVGKGLDKLKDKHLGEAAQVPPSLRTLGILRKAEDLARGYGKPVNTLHLLWAILEDRNCDAATLVAAETPDITSWITDIQDLLTEVTTRRHQILSFHNEEDKMTRSGHWSKKLAQACSSIGNKIVGQASAVQRVADTLTRSWAGLLGSGRPLASFLFVGPRGSGKQTLARNIAKFMYDDPERIIKLSLDEFSEEAQAERLLGTATGTVSEQEGVLSRIVREYPFSVVYLEDVERAHSKAMEGIHQMLERGHVFDGRGQRVEFRDNVIVLSVVVDPEFLEGDAPMGFRKNRKDSQDRQEQYERSLMPDLERVLRADTLGLVDEVVFFPPLGTTALTELLGNWSKELIFEMQQRHSIELSISEEVYASLIKHNEEVGQGAGSLRRLFVRQVCTNCARALLEGRIKPGDTVVINQVGEEQIFQRQTKKSSPARPRNSRKKPEETKDSKDNTEPLATEEKTE